MRWNHAELGLLQPADFIPIAEKCGLMVELDQYVLMHACRDCAQWADELGYALPVSVNLSAVQYQSATLLAGVRAALATAQVRPGLLTLELPESSLAMAHSLRGALAEVRSLGVKLARPKDDVVVMLGDGSYMMLNSEIASSVMLGQKLTIVVLDNRGFGCINRLQMATGGANFNNLLKDAKHEVLPEIDFVAHAASMGAVARKAASIAELEAALHEARGDDRTSVIVIDTDPLPSTEAGGHWWDVAVPEVSADRILFTPNFAPREEYEWALEEGLQVTLDNLHPLQEWPEIFAGKRLFVRLDPGQGRGHHEHVKTAGMHSKFGIPRFEIEELARLAEQAGTEIVGIHAHSGSGILDPENWRTVAGELIKVARRFPHVRALDLGGGLGVPERPGDRQFDLRQLDEALIEIRRACPDYELWLEPGRFLVARAGVLLTHVTQTKGKGEMHYIGVGTGMNSLIRPALYGAYHEIVNLSRLDEPATDTVTVVGPICETGDRLGIDRLLPASKEGDVILVLNTGAYGYVMGSNYNMRGIAKEVVI